MPKHYEEPEVANPEPVPKAPKAPKGKKAKAEKASEPAKKKGGGMRKLTDREKKLVKEHFEKHEPDATATRKRQVRMKLMRSTEIKSMKGLHKLAEHSSK